MANICFYVHFNYLEWCRFVKNRFFLLQTRNYILTVKQKFSDFPLLRSLRYKIRIFDAYVQKQWVKKRRVPVWARSVSVCDNCNIFTNIYPHLHSGEPTLVPHTHPPDYLKLSIDPKRTCSFWIYFNSTWCWCICAATINKNKSFSKETLSGLSLLIEKKNRCYYIVNFLCTLLTLFFSEFSTKTVSITLYIFVSSCFYTLKNKWSIM